LLSMVPEGDTEGLHTALAMGADRALVVSDPALGGSDALGTAKVLAAAVKRAGADLLVTATESSDGYTGTVPVQVAELLGWPAVSFARHLEISGDTVLVHRQTEAGYDEISCPLPAVVSVTAGVVEVRYPSFRGIMAARSKPVERLGLGKLGLSAAEVGASGARQEVVGAEDTDARRSGTIVAEEAGTAGQIVALLETWKVL
jgi:electron transfer flavoprotein beta subunit